MALQTVSKALTKKCSSLKKPNCARMSSCEWNEKYGCVEKIASLISKTEIDIPDLSFKYSKQLTKYNINSMIEEEYGVKLIDELKKFFNTNVSFLLPVGGGAYGNVYTLRVKNHVYIAKIIRLYSGYTKKDAQYEYFINQILYIDSKRYRRKNEEGKGFRISRPIGLFFFAHSDKKHRYCVIISKPKKYTLANGFFGTILQNRMPEELVIKIVDFINKIIVHFCEIPLTHDDLHIDNIGMTKDSKGEYHPVIIDFGLSILGICDPLIEILAFVRSIHYYKKLIDKNNYRILMREFNKNWQRKYNIDFEMENVVEQMFYKLFETLNQKRELVLETFDVNDIQILQKRINDKNFKLDL